MARSAGQRLPSAVIAGWLVRLRSRPWQHALDERRRGPSHERNQRYPVCGALTRSLATRAILCAPALALAPYALQALLGRTLQSLAGLWAAASPARLAHPQARPLQHADPQGPGGNPGVISH